MMFEETLRQIKPVDKTAEKAIQDRLDDLTKPPGSLGMLEELVKQYILATGIKEPKAGKKIIFVCAGDHGVCEEGISGFLPEVTPQMVVNMLAGGAGINALARHAGVEVRVVDVGVNADLDNLDGLIKRKVARGTKNFSKEPAMNEEQCLRAINVGIEMANTAADEGVTMIGTGEMGIGNTTPSSAIYGALLNSPLASLTGPGAGSDATKIIKKVKVIQDALELHKDKLKEPLSVLQHVGGLEIAAICGLCLGGAARRLPVVVDGFISSAAALIATRLKPEVMDYLFFAHRSAEPGHTRFIEENGIRPILQLEMRLGEGTGAALAMSIIDASFKMYTDMARFSQVNVSNKPMSCDG